MSHEILPPLPLDEWEETKTTLHLFSQIVGKVRMALSAEVNHWWHVPLYVSARGLTTGSIVTGGRALELELDFVDHALSIRASNASGERIPLEGVSVADFHGRVVAALDRMDIHPRFVARPFDPARVKSDIPFAEDTTHATYDGEYVQRLWHILIEVERVFREFRGRFVGKCSPVHLFWHSFDLAVTRFSGRAVELPADADRVTREAYSHEVISAGFWVGDDDVREPAFYTYVAPEPPGLAEEPLRPASAGWQTAGGSSMAIYRYEDFRSAKVPSEALLAFLQSAYEAGARRAAWPRGDVERGVGRT